MPADELRRIFGEDPSLYDRARPGYPGALFAGLAELADIGPASRVAEIGPGTGQATAALLARGAHVVAVELASSLAGALERKLDGAWLEVVVSAFEDWRLPPNPFDTVASFTSWHWLDPATRTPKVATALRPGGALVTVATIHVLGGTDEFFVDVQHCYDTWTAFTTGAWRRRSADDVPAVVDEVDRAVLAGRAPQVPAGRHLLGERVPRRAGHLLRPPRPGDEEPARTARQHRRPHRPLLRRHDHQAIPLRATSCPATTSRIARSATPIVPSTTICRSTGSSPR